MDRETMRRKLLLSVSRHRLQAKEQPLSGLLVPSADLLTGFKPYPLAPRYAVNQIGEVRRASDGKIVTQHLDKDGYSCVSITINGAHRKTRVHRMVALTYIPNPEAKPSVNHKDGIKHNNSLRNLEWVTAKENHAHARNVLRVGMNSVTVDQLLMAKIQGLIDVLTDLKKRDDCTRAMEEKINRALRGFSR